MIPLFLGVLLVSYSANEPHLPSDPMVFTVGIILMIYGITKGKF